MGQTDTERREARRLAKARERQREQVDAEWRQFFGGSIEFGRLMLEGDPDLYDKVADLYYRNYPPRLRDTGNANVNLLYPVRADSLGEALDALGFDPYAADGKSGAHIVNLDVEAKNGTARRSLNRQVTLRGNEYDEHDEAG